MKTIITMLLTILLFSLSCTEEETNTIDPRLQPYVTTVLQEAKAHNVTIPIHKITVQLKHNLTLEGRQLNAKCLRYNSGKVLIYVDYDYYITSEYLCVERTVFHEFGHALGRSHINTISIMNPKIGYLRCYNNDMELRQQLIDELFNNLLP